MLEALGGRKFLLTLIVLIIGTVIEVRTERGISQAFVALALGLVATFHTANTVITNKTASVQDAESKSIVDPKLDSRIDDLQSSVAALHEGVANIGQSTQISNTLLKAAIQMKG